MSQATKHEDMKSANILAVFNAVRSNGPITKKRIQELTGLSWGSIFNITTFLLERKIIAATGKLSSSCAGRCPEEFDLDTENILLIGIDISHTKVAGIVMDLKGNIRANACEPVTILSAEQLYIHARHCIDKLYAHVHDRSAIKGIGVSSIGYVDRKRGLLSPGTMLNLDTAIPLKDNLEREYGVEVVLEHDTICMATTEMLYGQAKGIDPFIYIRMSTGIGIGMYLNGDIYRGATGGEGEVGYTIVNPEGREYDYTKPGSLGSYASIRAIVRQAAKLAEQGLAPSLAHLAGERLPTIDEVAKAADSDPAVAVLFTEAAHFAGIALAGIINLLDPQRIILGGEMTRYEKLFVERLREEVNNYIWKRAPVEIVCSRFDNSAACIGSASLVIMQVFLKATDILGNS